MGQKSSLADFYTSRSKKRHVASLDRGDGECSICLSESDMGTLAAVILLHAQSCNSLMRDL